MEKFFLRPDVKIEPLILKWYAWSYLVSPTVSGFNLIDRYLKILESFVNNPHIHMQAVKNPKLIGGPFVDLSEDYVVKAKELIEIINKDARNLIDLAHEIKVFYKNINRNALGNSLEELYKTLPNSLKGAVEITYDLNNQPSLRLIEHIFYQKFFKNNNQSILFSKINNDQRPFSMSTPRFPTKLDLELQISFDSPVLDKIFQMKDIPETIVDIRQFLDIPPNQLNLFKTFLTSESPKKFNNNYNKAGLRIRYYGHACVLLESNDTSIIFDPIISYDINSNVNRYTFGDLPDQIDYVVLTHNHMDHILFETLLQLRYKVKNIVVPRNNNGNLLDPSLELMFKNLGFKSVISLSEFEKIKFFDGDIMGVPFFGEHGDLNIQSKLAYFVNFLGTKFIFAADSNNLDPYLYDHIHSNTGDIDFLFLGMECDGAPLSWIYGPLFIDPISRSDDQSRTLSGSDYKKAISIVDKLKCKHAYVYAMGQEPWLGYIMALNYNKNSPQIIESNKFIEECKKKGIKSERLFCLKEWVLN